MWSSLLHPTNFEMFPLSLLHQYLIFHVIVKGLRHRIVWLMWSSLLHPTNFEMFPLSLLHQYLIFHVIVKGQRHQIVWLMWSSLLHPTNFEMFPLSLLHQYLIFHVIVKGLRHRIVWLFWSSYLHLKIMSCFLYHCYKNLKCMIFPVIVKELIFFCFSFGMEHDGLGNECKYAINDDRYIMSPTQSLSNHPYMWSSCSRSYIRKFLL